jgi:hypothetical protein
MDVASFIERIMELPIPRERLGKIKKKIRQDSRQSDHIRTGYIPAISRNLYRVTNVLGTGRDSYRIPVHPVLTSS